MGVYLFNYYSSLVVLVESRGGWRLCQAERAANTNVTTILNGFSEGNGEEFFQIVPSFIFLFCIYITKKNLLLSSIITLNYNSSLYYPSTITY